MIKKIINKIKKRKNSQEQFKEVKQTLEN